MNEKELPPNERIAFLEQENAVLKKSNVELEKITRKKWLA